MPSQPARRPGRGSAQPKGFASRVPSCFTYPLNLKYLLLIFGAAALSTIASLFPVGTSIAYYFILLVVARVGFDVIDRFAAGYGTHAETPDDFPSGGFGRPVRWWLVLLGMDFLIARYLRKYGYAAAIGMDIVTSLILPGMTIVLAMTRSFKQAVNPVEWLRVAKAAPGAFVLLALLSLGIDQLGYFAGDLLFPDVDTSNDDEAVERGPPLAAIFAYSGLVTYLNLANFCMEGLYIHAFGAQLGVEDEKAEKAEAAMPPEARAANAAASFAMTVRADIAKGKLAEAEKAAYESMREDPYDVSRHALYHETLMAAPDKGKAVAHAKRYLALLVKSGKPREAIALFKRATEVDPAFRPEQPEEVLPLAKSAREIKDPNAAVAIVRGFDKANPGHPDIPAVYLFSARLLAEDLDNGDMARKILQHLVNKYPAHSVAAEAKTYLQAMPGPA
jgi:tetratricopeptide (TPR) repeat protein